MAGVVLDYQIPALRLAPYISTFYRLQTVAGLDEVERADRAQLRLRLTPGNAHYVFADGSRQEATPLHLLGPTSGAFTVRAEGPLLVFGMGLTPAGWEALIDDDASLLLNRVADAAAVLGESLTEAAARLGPEQDIAMMAAIVEPVLDAMLRPPQNGTRSFVEAVDAWLADAPSPSLDALADATGLSRRQVERRCNQLYGAPPKLLARKYRALRAAVALSKQRGGEMPVIEGFYDQSHMIREIKQFTGMTPRQVRTGGGGWLTQLSIQHRSALEGSVPPIVSRT